MEVADQEPASGTLDLLDTVVIRLDGMGRLIQMNAAAENCFLVSRNRATGRVIWEVAAVPLELRDAIQDRKSVV